MIAAMTASVLARRICASRERRGGNEFWRVLAGNRKPCQSAGKLAAAMTKIGTSRTVAPGPSPKLRHSRNAGGSR